MLFFTVIEEHKRAKQLKGEKNVTRLKKASKAIFLK